MATRWTWRATSDDQSILLNGNQWHGLNVFHSMTGKKANKTPQHTTQEYSIVEVNTCEAEKYLLLSILYNELFCEFNKILKIVFKTRDKIWAGTTVWQEEFEDREKFIDWFNKYLLSSLRLADLRGRPWTKDSHASQFLRNSFQKDQWASGGSQRWKGENSELQREV